MEALTARAALVDPATLGDEGAVTTVIPRSEIEEAMRDAGPTDLFLDVERTRNGEHETKRIMVSWEPDDLERLLETTPSDNVALAFKPEELARMFEESDVEAHGLREKAAILSVAAATAVGVTAGVANAQLAMGDSGVGSATAPKVMTDTTSSGPGAVGAQTGTEQSQFVTDVTSGGPATEAPATGGAQFVTDVTSGGPATEAPATGGTEFVTDVTSGGPATEAPAEATAAGGGTEFVTDATTSGPRPVETAAATAGGGGGESFLETSGGAVALAGGITLLIAAAGFVATRRRPGPRPA